MDFSSVHIKYISVPNSVQDNKVNKTTGDGRKIWRLGCPGLRVVRLCECEIESCRKSFYLFD